MEAHEISADNRLKKTVASLRVRSVYKIISRHLTFAAAALFLFYLSLALTTSPVTSSERETLDRSINVLETKGFEREAFLLRYTATFRRTDNYLNEFTDKENAYAATNFPFEIITLYPDFYTKTSDDTERAMILLHEAQHLQGKDERAAYGYVWRNRQKLGWTILSHGTTESYITIELQTRESAPELFTCAANLWNDCTENIQAQNHNSASGQSR